MLRDQSASHEVEVRGNGHHERTRAMVTKESL